MSYHRNNDLLLLRTNGKYKVLKRAKYDGKAKNEGNSWFTKNGYEQSYCYKNGKRICVKVRKGKKIVKYIPINLFIRPKMCYKTNPKIKKVQKLSDFF